MYLIKYLRGDSLLHKTDPRVKLLLILLYTTLIFMVENYIVLAIMLFLIISLWSYGGLPFKTLKGYIPFFLPLMIFLIVVQGLFTPGMKYLLTLKGYHLFSIRGLLLGSLLCLRLFILILLMPTLMLSTETEELILGLIGLKVPYRVAFLITTALNQIPALKEDITSIINAQKMRGFTVFDKGHFWQKLRSYPVLVVPLIIGAMRRAQTMGVAMDARAFGASTSRTYRKELKLTKSDVATLIMFTLMAIFLLMANYYLDCSLLLGESI